MIPLAWLSGAPNAPLVPLDPALTLPPLPLELFNPLDEDAFAELLVPSIPPSGPSLELPEAPFPLLVFPNFPLIFLLF